MFFPRHGFYSTFYIPSSDPKSAFESLGLLLSERMKVSSIMCVGNGFFRTRVFVDEVWEISDQGQIDVGIESGFSFFRMGLVDVVFALIKIKWIEIFRRHLLVNISV